MTHIDVGNACARLAYRKSGSGPDLVFVHGWPLHGETWRAIVPRLATRLTCHVFDLPGTGRSEWSDATPITRRAHADAGLTAIATLGLRQVGFVARSGGEVRQELGGVVVGAVEETVDGALDALAHGVEEQHHDRRRQGDRRSRVLARELAEERLEEDDGADK